MAISNSDPKEMTNLIRFLMHEVGFMIDFFYEDDDIGLLAHEDRTFRTFRRGVQWMHEIGLIKE